MPMTIKETDVGNETDVIARRKSGLGGARAGEVHERLVAVDIDAPEQDMPVHRPACSRFQETVLHDLAVVTRWRPEKDHHGHVMREGAGTKPGKIDRPLQSLRRQRTEKKQCARRQHLRQRRQPFTITPTRLQAGPPF